MNPTEIAQLFYLDPYAISLMLFILVTINTCVDLNFRLIEMGTTVNNVSRGRLLWFYFSASYTYILKTIIALFVIFALITVTVVIIVAIIYIIKSAGSVMSKGNSKDQILSNLSQGIIGAISKYAKFNIEFVFKFLMNSDALIGFFVILPMFMLVFMAAFAFSLYQPTTAITSDNPDDGPKKSMVMATYHHYLYYIFAVFVTGVILFVVYQNIMGNMK